MTEGVKFDQPPEPDHDVGVATALLNRRGVRILPGHVIGVWSDLDCPEIRQALRLLGTGELPVKYLDDDVPVKYKLREVPGEPVPTYVLEAMKQDTEPWTVRDKLLGKNWRFEPWPLGPPENPSPIGTRMSAPPGREHKDFEVHRRLTLAEEGGKMAIIAKVGNSFTPAPQGTHAAVCVDVVDLGFVDETFQLKTHRRQKIEIGWQIDANMENGKPFLVRRRYTCSLHEKATLRRDLESWRGRSFSDTELQNFDLELLIGVGCLINVIHEQRNGSTFANVASVMPLPKNMKAPAPRDHKRVCDRQPADPESGDPADGVPF